MSPLDDARSPAAARDRIGVEIGGTFTDLVWSGADGRLYTGKTPSTPSAIQEAVLRVIEEAGRPLADVARVTHGSTVATNALIQRRGAQAGLLTTKGFRDIITIARGDRNGVVYEMQYRRSAPPVRRSMVREVSERIAADGSVLTPIDLDAAWGEVQAFLDQGVEGIAICLLHAYRNPAHEQALAAMIRERAPHVAVSVSHEVSPEFREYERSVTTVVNAFVGPVVESYVGRLEKGLAERGYDGVLQIMQSNGGVMPAQAAGANAVRMLLSGPAAGVRAAMWYAERNGIRNAITLDMGGTSTDIAIAPGLVPAMVPELKVDGLPVRTTSVDMETIGAGGGSIAAIDPGGFLAVGPESAGAQPGPACYGRGGIRPTVTDAQVIAGILPPSRFFGGRMALDIEKARAALDSLGLPGGTAAAADAVLRIANSNIASAVRQVSTSKGIDPRDYVLIAYGGGGPVHTAMVAEDLGIRQVLVPWSPGLTSAFGLLIAETMIDVAESDLHSLSDRTLDTERLARLTARAAEIAAGHGLSEKGHSLRIGIDMRYAGQAFELTIWADPRTLDAASLRAMFEAEHRTRYGYARAALTVQVVAYRLRLTQASGSAVTTPLPTGQDLAREEVTVTLGGKRLTAVSMARDALLPGASVAGPAILAEPTSTTFVPDGWQAECLPTGDLMLKDLRQ